MIAENENAPEKRTWPRLLPGGIALVGVLLALFWYAGGWRATPEIPGGDLTEGDAEVVAAVSSAREAVARDPNSGQTWGRLGQVLHVHNYLGSAQVCYAEAMKRDPDPTWPYLRGVIALVGAEPATAIPDLQRAIELGGLKNLPRLRLGELYLDLGQHKEAEAEFRQVLSARPRDPRAHLGLARVALAQQQWESALQHLQATTDVPFIQKEVHSLQLIAYQNLGKQAEVKHQLDWLAQLPEDHPWPDSVVDQLARYQVGVRPRVIHAMQMMRQGKADAGLKALQALARDYPDSDIPLTALGRAWALVGQFPAAEEALRHSLQLSPQSGDVWLSLGIVYHKQNKHAAALECFQKVNQLKSTDAEGYSRAADCQVELGQREAAIESYRRALRCQPDLREAREGLDRLLKEQPGSL